MSCEHTQRCSGDCCRKFYLPYSMQGLRDLLERSKVGADEDRVYPTGISGKDYFIEVTKVVEMVVPLEDAAKAAQSIHGGPPPKEGWYYTCRHLNVITGNCTNYENRPNVCRDYPFYGSGYQNRCRYEGCTWEEGRNPPIPAANLSRRIERQYVAKLSEDLDGIKHSSDPDTSKAAA